MNAEAWIALASVSSVVLGSVAFHMVMVARWAARIEAELKRQQERTDHLYGRDERIFDKLDTLLEGQHKVEVWIAGQEGRAAMKEKKT